jgi:hypothetical protein
VLGRGRWLGPHGLRLRLRVGLGTRHIRRRHPDPSHPFLGSLPHHTLGRPLSHVAGATRATETIRPLR